MIIGVPAIAFCVGQFRPAADIVAEKMAFALIIRPMH